MSQQKNNEIPHYFYRASAADFGKVPGSPISYWISEKIAESFKNDLPLKKLLDIRAGMSTTDNQLFLRQWFEIDISNMAKSCENKEDAMESGRKWFPYIKGGTFRRWYGNNDFVVNWRGDGEDIKRYIAERPEKQVGGRLVNMDCFFKPCIAWTRISSGSFSCRYYPSGSIFSDASNGGFGEEISVHGALLLLNTKIISKILSLISPTINFYAGDISRIPTKNKSIDIAFFDDLIVRSRSDWDSFEFSWDFNKLPLVNSEWQQITLSKSYKKLRSCWLETTLEMQHLEEENNRLFIDAYGLQDELTPEVPLSEITLTCNPHYRYGGNLTDEEREARLQSDTIAELISYAIGCMMGRYSLDREGLVYAHAGNEGFKALVEEGAYATFAADEDGILPLSTDSWFADDVATRLEAFVCTVWGKEPLEENLQFIADSLCLAAIKPVKKGGETSRETLRRYLSTQFYKDHLKTYKKRPIYWLFSSGKEKAFECLVYLHRYNEATLPRMRTEYVTPLLGQMAGRIERLRLQQAEAGTAEAKRIGKDIDSLTKQLTELRAFDDELKHHADMRIRLDLDDGVKVNYGKFGTLLSDVKAITGDKGE